MHSHVPNGVRQSMLNRFAPELAHFLCTSKLISMSAEMASQNHPFRKMTLHLDATTPVLA
jgi:hypothetical protein